MQTMINKYRIFLKVVERGSLTKAGKELELTQSAVSHAIANLEKEFGFSLFTRSRAGIELSQNGERVLRYIEAIIQINESMIQEIADMNSLDLGSIKIGSSQAISERWLPGIITKFSEQYPTIHLQVIEASNKELEALTLEGKLDFSFIYLPTSSQLETLNLISDRSYIISNVSQADLFKPAPNQLIIPNCYSPQEMNQFTKITGLERSRVFEVDNLYSIIGLVKNNLCQAILPELFVKQLDDHLLKTELPNSERAIAIATRSVKNLSLASEKFIAITSLWLNEHHAQGMGIDDEIHS